VTDPQPPRVIVVNLKFDPYDVYVGRAGKQQDGTFGNPFNAGTRETNCANFERYFLQRMGIDRHYRTAVLALRAKAKPGQPLRLGCFCAPVTPCHAETIARWLEQHWDDS
jgi:hypothetical protein